METATQLDSENNNANLAFGANDVLNAIRSNPGLGRSKLLELSRIQSVNWLPAINSLMEANLIRREGERKGARYFAV